MRPGAQAEIVPSSVPKIKAAAMPLGFVVEPVSGTTNVDLGFHIMPVGIGFGEFLVLTVLQA
jgi:hypothetical protein